MNNQFIITILLKELKEAEDYKDCYGIYYIIHRENNIIGLRLAHASYGSISGYFNGDPGGGAMLCISPAAPTDPIALCYNNRTNKFTQILNHLYYIQDKNTNSMLNEVESIIDTITQINSFQSSNASYPAQNAALTRDRCKFSS